MIIRNKSNKPVGIGGANLVVIMPDEEKSVLDADANTNGIKTLERMGFEFDEIRVLGGGSVSPLWNQTKADITGKVICQTSTPDAGCLGAAIVAGTGCGLYSDMKEAVDHMVKIKARYIPDESNRAMYEEQFEKYVRLYEALCPVFESDN